MRTAFVEYCAICKKGIASAKTPEETSAEEYTKELIDGGWKNTKKGMICPKCVDDLTPVETIPTEQETETGQ